MSTVGSNVGPEMKWAGKVLAHPPGPKAKPELEARQMTILFDATVSRKPARSARRFGAGVLPTRTARRDTISPGDRQWWAEESNRDATDYDLMAGEFEAQVRIENGCLL